MILYTNFRSQNVRKVDIECKFSTVVSIDFLHVYESKYCLQVYLENCRHKNSSTETQKLSG